MQNVLNGGSPYFSPSQMNPSVHGWNQSIDAGISNFLGPPMYAPSPAMMLPMMMTMLNQMMMMFMQGAAQSQSHFPFQEQTGLPQPYMNMPWGPPPQMHHPDYGPGPQFQPQYIPQPQYPQRPQTEQRPPVPRPQLQAPRPEPRKPPVHPKTQTRNYDPTKDAAALNKAMHGGMLGLGTDEEAIMKALRGKSKEEVEALKSNYKDHYGRDLMKDLKSELGKKDMAQVNDLMKGDTSKADARVLQRATSGWGDDEKAVFETLEGKSADERKAIMAEYKKLTGKDLDQTLKSRFSKKEYQQASALMEGDTAKADAVKLRDAMSGLGDDEAAVYKTLEGKSAEEREAIKKEFKALTGKDLTQRMGERLNKTERARAEGLLNGDNSKADAAKLHQAMKGMGTDEDAIFETLKGKSKEELAALSETYKKEYGIDLEKRLAQDMGGNDLERAKTLLKEGDVSDANKLKYAMEGLGTDEDAVKAALAGKTKEEIATIKADYQRETGRSLEADLKSELGGRDEFEAMQALKGKPKSLEEAVERANERYKFERKGLGNAISSGVMDMVNDKGELLDKNNSRMNEQMDAYKTALAEGRHEDAKIERARLEQLMGYSNLDVDSYQESKDAVADTAGTVAATAASVAVVVATAGTATPLVATALAAAGTGAATRVGVTAAVAGSGYDAQDIAKDAAIGAVDGATVVVGAGAGRAAAAGLKGAGRGSQVARAAVGGAVDGVVGGSAGGAAAAALEEDTWKDGFGEGLSRVGKSATLGAALGGVAGGGVGATFDVAPGMIRRASELGEQGRKVAGDFGRRGADAARDLGQQGKKLWGQYMEFDARVQQKIKDAVFSGDGSGLRGKAKEFFDKARSSGGFRDAFSREGFQNMGQKGKKLWGQYMEFDARVQQKIKDAIFSGDGSGLRGKAKEFFDKARSSGGFRDTFTREGFQNMGQKGKKLWGQYMEFDARVQQKIKDAIFSGDGSGLRGKAKEFFDKAQNSDAYQQFRDFTRRTGEDFKQRGKKAWDDFNQGTKDSGQSQGSRHSHGSHQNRGSSGSQGTGGRTTSGSRFKNDFDALGVDSNASAADIKKAYRRAAMKHHPDRGGDPALFRQADEAWKRIRETPEFKAKQQAEQAAAKAQKEADAASTAKPRDTGTEAAPSTTRADADVKPQPKPKADEPLLIGGPKANQQQPVRVDVRDPQAAKFMDEMGDYIGKNTELVAEGKLSREAFDTNVNGLRKKAEDQVASTLDGAVRNGQLPAKDVELFKLGQQVGQYTREGSLQVKNGTLSQKAFDEHLAALNASIEALQGDGAKTILVVLS